MEASSSRSRSRNLHRAVDTFEMEKASTQSCKIWLNSLENALVLAFVEQHTRSTRATSGPGASHHSQRHFFSRLHKRKPSLDEQQGNGINNLTREQTSCQSWQSYSTVVCEDA